MGVVSGGRRAAVIWVTEVAMWAAASLVVEGMVPFQVGMGVHMVGVVTVVVVRERQRPRYASRPRVAPKSLHQALC